MGVYAIPFQGQMVIYKPRRHLAFIGNAALASYLGTRDEMPATSRRPDIEQFLESVGFDRPGLECAADGPGASPPRPTAAVLLMTNRCNLRCVYCYANAGAEPRTTEMEWPTARVTIDHVIDNARRAGAEPPSLTFHGGGEPTVHWDLLTRAVEYARQRDERTLVSMSSNGVWSDAQRRYICRHFRDVSLSMDGTPAVQNRQRPRADGGETFGAVMDSIAAMDEAGVDYGIRMTVLEDSVDALPEGAAFICENTGARAIQIEPTFTHSRGVYGDIGMEFADAFSQRFMDAWRIGRSAGRQVYYSGARPWVIAPMFCQAPLKAAVATSDGRLVTCFEVFSESSPMAGSFTVGHVRDECLEYDGAALRAFWDAQQRRRAECEDCFCYWHCCGDCATRRPGPRETGAGRCRVTRNITLAMLAQFIAESDGVWQGLRETTRAMPDGCEDAGRSAVDRGES